MSQTAIRITSLLKRLETIEKAADSLIKSGLITFKTNDEVEAFKKGIRTALDMIRNEFK